MSIWSPQESCFHKGNSNWVLADNEPKSKKCHWTPFGCSFVSEEKHELKLKAFFLFIVKSCYEYNDTLTTYLANTCFHILPYQIWSLCFASCSLFLQLIIYTKSLHTAGWRLFLKGCEDRKKK